MLICFNKVTACVMYWMKYNRKGLGEEVGGEVKEGDGGGGALSLQDIYI
jgi:hypothetical protein